MRAFTLDGFDVPAGLRDDLPAPQPADTDLLVRVHASSVNPVDAAITAGALREMMEHEFPVMLGRDYAGVVEEVGSGVSRYAVGDEVFGFVLHANPTVHDGSWAELIELPEDNCVARRPANMELAGAGAAPLAGITALLCVDALDLSEGDTVLFTSPENLERLAQLLDDGVLRVRLQNSYALDQAAEAMNALGATHTQGKLGIEVS